MPKKCLLTFVSLHNIESRIPVPYFFHSTFYFASHKSYTRFNNMWNLAIILIAASTLVSARTDRHPFNLDEANAEITSSYLTQPSESTSLPFEKTSAEFNALKETTKATFLDSKEDYDELEDELDDEEDEYDDDCDDLEDDEDVYEEDEDVYEEDEDDFDEDDDDEYMTESPDYSYGSFLSKLADVGEKFLQHEAGQHAFDAATKGGMAGYFAGGVPGAAVGGIINGGRAFVEKGGLDIFSDDE